jgi:hypothetical protein
MSARPDPCPYCGRADFGTRFAQRAHVGRCRRAQPGYDPLADCPHCGRADFARACERTNHVRWCARRGGATPRVRPPRPPAKAPPAKDPREPCPHCGRADFAQRSSRAMHILYCADNPERRDGPVVRPPRPTLATPCPHCAQVGRWPTLASRAQHVRQCRQNPARVLLGAARGRIPAPTCRHCGERFDRAAWRDAHEGRCAKNPAVVLARAQAALAEVRASAPASAGPYVCPVCGGVAHAEAIGGGRCVQCKREGRS